MNNAKLLFSTPSQWKGKQYISELYQSDQPTSVSPITQAQAVCFLDPNHLVFYKNVNGFYGNPGGGIEPNESYEQTIKRELIEEAQLQLIQLHFFGYEYIIDLANPTKNAYFLRGVAKVTLIDKPIEDPCHKAIERVVVDLKDAAQTLNWGKKGELLINLAHQTFLQKCN